MNQLSPAQHARFRRIGGIVLFVLVTLAMLRASLYTQPVVSGDGTEYMTMAQSWLRHGSPEAQLSDFAVTARHLPHQKGVNVAAGYYIANNGKLYSYHFPAYSLLCVPATMFFQQRGDTLLAAFTATNIILFALAVASILFFAALTTPQKTVFTGFLVISPICSYMSFSGVELYILSFVVMALAALSHHRYPLAALLVAIAALQCPPAIALLIYIFGLAVASKNTRSILLTLASASVAITPLVYYQALFGVPNIISATGGARISNISISRIVSVYFDLSQGMLPYIPGTMLLAAYALCVALARRQWEILLLGVVALGTVILTTTVENWNSGSMGMMRYLIWIFPLYLWIVTRTFSFQSTRARVVVIAAAACHFSIVATNATDSLHFSPQARLVMDIVPWYPVEEEIRMERTYQFEVPSTYYDRVPMAPPVVAR